MLEGIGSPMNWLFGTATSKQFSKLNNRFNELSRRTGDIVHILQDHASLINETLWETRTITHKLLNLSAEIANLHLKNVQFAKKHSR